MFQADKVLRGAEQEVGSSRRGGGAGAGAEHRDGQRRQGMVPGQRRSVSITRLFLALISLQGSFENGDADILSLSLHFYCQTHLSHFH